MIPIKAMTKYRRIKNVKHSVRKLRNIVRRKGDDWAYFDKKTRLASRKSADTEIKDQLTERHDQVAKVYK